MVLQGVLPRPIWILILQGLQKRLICNKILALPVSTEVKAGRSQRLDTSAQQEHSRLLDVSKHQRLPALQVGMIGYRLGHAVFVHALRALGQLTHYRWKQNR